MNQQNIYTATFDGIPVRFVLMPNQQAIFVSREDVIQALSVCMTDDMRPALDKIGVEGFDYFADKTEKAAAVIEVDTIGPVVNAFSPGNLIHNLSEMRNVEQEGIRESAFRISSLYLWFSNIFSMASDHFDLTLVDTLHMANDHLDKHIPAYVVNVEEYDGVWVAVCDELGLVTEADSFEELTERVWKIAPELAELNIENVDIDNLRLRFEHTETNKQRMSG